MNLALLELIREEFIKALQAKTGWGKNEVLNEFDKAVYRATLKILDIKEKRNDSNIQ